MQHIGSYIHDIFTYVRMYVCACIVLYTSLVKPACVKTEGGLGSGPQDYICTYIHVRTSYSTCTYHIPGKFRGVKLS